MVLDVNHVIIVCLIHVLIMVYVHKQQRVTYVHAHILTLVLIVNKVRSFSMRCLSIDSFLPISDHYYHDHNNCRYTCTMSYLWMRCYSMSNDSSNKSMLPKSLVRSSLHQFIEYHYYRFLVYSQNMGGCAVQNNAARCYCPDAYQGYYCQYRMSAI